ncbi:hypothetical protein [uncultured Alistipes sp.]|uniref:dual OB domain-containing protein n=1 Tax=uncultured Alistipes sp. TaxID=538949 RepID=UPI00261974BA|nr:hypothetical protein [uncultured Alistipes sp.]
MSIYMLCLANSYKCGGRCIAGIQLNKLQKGHFTIVRDPNTKGPKWVRPISHHNDTGEIPNQEAWGIPVLSIIEITNPQPHPSTSHSEDIYYEKLICIDDPFVKPTMATLDLLIDTQHKLIFGNRGKAVTPENFQLGDYSVMLVKAINAEIYLEEKYSKERVKFSHQETTYDFPITDPVFLNKIKSDPSLNKTYDVLYLVISLGILHEGWHSKLVATIIEPIH